MSGIVEVEVEDEVEVEANVKVPSSIYFNTGKLAIKS